MKGIVKFIKWLTLSVVALTVVSCALLVVFMPKCDGTSPAAIYARTLPAERLEELYEYLLEYKNRREARSKYSHPIHISYKQRPKGLEDLEFQNIRISTFGSRVMLEGCFDNFLTMQIEGLYGKKPPKIYLNWGEFESVSETLWEK